jgi:uncharacterized protein (TIGR02001 family)
MTYLAIPVFLISSTRESIMNKTILAALLVTAFANQAALADEPQLATPQEHEAELTFNAALVSDYRYRGISQTRLAPALQAGPDFVHKPSGFYVGAWTSSIQWTKDAGGGGDVELDLYAGNRGELAKDLGYDIGALTYVYPSNGLGHVAGFVSANTTEVYGQLSYGPGLIKYSHAVSNLFGFADSKGSGYLDLAANPDVGHGYLANLHLGHQRVLHNAAASYSDWKIGVTKDYGMVTAALAMIGTNAGKDAYASPANGKFLGKSALVLTIGRSF